MSIISEPRKLENGGAIPVTQKTRDLEPHWYAVTQKKFV
jgi:hypothetical protein